MDHTLSSLSVRFQIFSLPIPLITFGTVDDTDKIVGTGTLVVERKFIHDLGIVGHIEDIAVSKDQQGKKLGLRIINALDYIAAEVGCYKVC